MRTASTHRGLCCVATLIVLLLSAGCSSWHGVNSLPLPGTEGTGPGSFQIRAQMPDVTNISENSRVRVGDVTVGNVTRIERQGWHALVTMRLNGDVVLPANAIATIGQTSLLGTLHVELAPPTGTAAEGRLHDGSLIALTASGSYPTTEQTLSAASLLLNGGGVGQIGDITKAFSTAWAGRENDLRSLIGQVELFIDRLNAQKHDILTATDSLSGLVGQFADQKPTLDRALATIPSALHVLKEQRDKLADAFDRLSTFSAHVNNTFGQSKAALVQELKNLAPVLESLANAGPSLVHAMSSFATLPWPAETLTNWFRGDYANLTAIFDLTLSRLDSSLFTGTRWEGNLTELEMQWGRTIGQMPSPYTAGNPLVAPYHLDQGP
ncbi:MCE family protein [Mycolicibacterium sp. HS_4_1]